MLPTHLRLLIFGDSLKIWLRSLQVSIIQQNVQGGGVQIVWNRAKQKLLIDPFIIRSAMLNASEIH